MAETGQFTCFAPIGMIEAATDLGRLEEYRRVVDFNRTCVLDGQEISPAQIVNVAVMLATALAARRRVPLPRYATRRTSCTPWPR